MVNGWRDRLMEEAISTYIQEIRETRDYQTYERLYQQVCQNEDIQQLVSKIRTLQQELVKQTASGKSTNLLSEQVDQITEELYQIPLYLDYIEAVDQFSFFLAQQKLVIDEYISKTIQF